MASLHDEIQRKITEKGINYAAYFPGSPRATAPKKNSTLMEALPTKQLETCQARHIHTSTLLTAGQNPWYVAAQLGHEDVEIVFRTYGRFIREDYQKPQPELRIVGSR